MSAATDLYDPQFDPQFDPHLSPVPGPPRRHLAAVPTGTAWSAPVRTAPAGPAEVDLGGSVSVLHAPEPMATPLRLTRRGVVVLSLLVVAVGAMVVWLAALSNSTGTSAGRSVPAEVPAAATSVTVEAGDTLWSIAGRVAPGTDPRAEVEQLRRLNGIDDAALVPGQRLQVR